MVLFGHSFSVQFLHSLCCSSWVSALQVPPNTLCCGRASQSTWVLYWQDSPAPFQMWGSCRSPLLHLGSKSQWLWDSIWKQWLRALSWALMASVSMGTSVDVLSWSESRKKKSIKLSSLRKCESITSGILSFCRKHRMIVFFLELIWWFMTMIWKQNR